jgi:addiction module RelE/StbE family toxin
VTIKLNKSFRRQAKRLKPAQQKRLKQALRLFLREPHHPDLYNHILKGEWKGHRSIAIGGDWRAHYKLVGDDVALFVAVGTHSQLYV